MTELAAEAVIVRGIFIDPDGLNRAVEGLRRNGFEKTKVSAALVRRKESEGAAQQQRRDAQQLRRNCIAGLTAGAAAGGVVGLLGGLRLFPSSSTGTLAALSGLVGGVGAGAAVGVLYGAVGAPPALEPVASAKEGGIVLSINCASGIWAHKAKQVLAETHAIDISETPLTPAETTGISEPRFAAMNQA